MALPRINTPTFSLELPSNKQKIIYRPFQVKEEKILLIAQKSDKVDDQIRAIKQIIKNCILEPEDFDVDSIASFDLEYIFLKLRAKSVGEIVKIKIIPQEREGLPPMPAEVNIDELSPYFDPDHTDMVTIDEKTQLKMKYPTVQDILQLDSKGDQERILFGILRDSIDVIYSDGEVYEAKDYSSTELDEFLDSFSSKQFEKVQKFFATLPKIRKEIVYTWTNPEDEKDTHTETVVLQGLMSFLS